MVARKLMHDRRVSTPKLVASIFVLGILIVAVYQRSVQQEAERRSHAINGLAGSVRSAAAFAHAKWLSEGSYSTAINLGHEQTIEIDLLTGYPSANSNGIRGLLSEIDGFSGIDRGASYVFSLVGVSASLCNVTYATGKVAGEPPRVTVRNNKNGGDCG